MTVSARRALYAAALLTVLVGTTGVLVYLGSREFIGFDSYWHVFIARQDRWPNFWHEVRDNAHPPLFYLALRVASAWIGATRLAYRAVSIIAIVTATGLIAVIVRRITANAPLAIAAAAAFGYAEGVIMVGLEVRAYALCAAFTLLAVVFYLDWLSASARRLRVWTCAGFALAATAAVATHYSTFFFLAATIATPVLLAAMSRSWRRRLTASVAAHPLATALMFGIPLAAAAVAYLIHVRLWTTGSLTYLPTFMFNPATETRLSFLLRNTINLLAIAVPGSTPATIGIENTTQWLSTAVVAIVGVAGAVQLGRAKAPRLAAVPLLLTAIMIALNAAGGLFQRYPYGGVARHEFFLIPLALVGFFGLIEVIRRGLPRVLASRALWTAIVAGAVAASIASWTSVFHLERESLYQSQINHFRRLIPSPGAVLLDNYSFLNFFSHYDDWTWRVAGEWAGHEVQQVWRVSKDGQRFSVCRSAPWSVDMTKRSTYDSIIECADRSGARRVSIFRTHWQDPSPAVAVVNAQMAADDGLTPIVMGADGTDLYAQFEIDPAMIDDCSAPVPTPADLHVIANRGRQVVLGWTAVGSPQMAYVLEAGLTPGQNDALSTTIRRATTFTINGVTPATYYARLRAVGLCGASPPSPELRVVVE